MNMIYLTFNISELEEILALLDALDITQYQVFDMVCAHTTGGTPRMDTPVWPGYNAAIMIQVDTAMTALIIQKITDFNNQTSSPDERITLCSWPVSTFLQ